MRWQMLKHKRIPALCGKGFDQFKGCTRDALEIAGDGKENRRGHCCKAVIVEVARSYTSVAVAPVTGINGIRYYKGRTMQFFFQAISLLLPVFLVHSLSQR